MTMMMVVGTGAEMGINKILLNYGYANASRFFGLRPAQKEFEGVLIYNKSDKYVTRIHPT